MIHIYKKFFISTVICVLILITISMSNLRAHVNYYLHPTEGIHCYDYQLESLPDISDTKPSERSIFFHETSCTSYLNGKISISARQACAVESAALLNPSSEVYLLYASPGLIKNEGTDSDRFLQALVRYQNVEILHVDYTKYTKGTPVEDLYTSGRIKGSDYARAHSSDVLRFLTLWKYGGIYLDLDVIVTKNLENLPPNFSGSESDINVAAGVMSFSSTGFGHELAEVCLKDLRNNFKGDEWGYNGPGVITRLLKKICGVSKAKDMKSCKGFKVYPPEAFYPIPWWNWTMYFERDSLGEVMARAKNSYVIHVWNKHSVSNKIPIHSRVPYTEFARQYCPEVFKRCDMFF